MPSNIPISDEETANQSTARNAQPLNPFFRLVVVAAGSFIVTILASIATMFGNEQAPLTRFLNHYGGGLMAGEVALTLVAGLLALITDRRQSGRRLQTRTGMAAASVADTDEDSPSNRPPPET